MRTRRTRNEDVDFVKRDALIRSENLRGKLERETLLVNVLSDFEDIVAENYKLAEANREMTGLISALVSASKREGFRNPNAFRIVEEMEYFLKPEPKHDLRFCRCHCVHGVAFGDEFACVVCENST